MADKITYQVYWSVYKGPEILGSKLMLLFESQSIKDAIDWVTKYIEFPEKVNLYRFSGQSNSVEIYKVVNGVSEERPKHIRLKGSIWPPQPK